MPQFNSETFCILEKLKSVASKRRHKGQVPTTRKLTKQLVTAMQQNHLPFGGTENAEKEAIKLILNELNYDRMMNSEICYGTEPFKASASLLTASQEVLNTAIDSHRGKAAPGDIKRPAAMVAARALRILINLP